VHQSHPISVSLSGLSVEALAVLMATVIQGQVLWVYNKDIKPV